MVQKCIYKKSEDQLFDHWLREDLRRAICARDQAIRNREDLKGIAGANIDFASTVQMMRAKKTMKRGEKVAEPCQNPSIDEPGRQENQERFQLNANQKGCMRSILGGAVPTGERLFKARLRKTALEMSRQSSICGGNALPLKNAEKT